MIKKYYKLIIIILSLFVLTSCKTKREKELDKATLLFSEVSNHLYNIFNEKEYNVGDLLPSTYQNIDIEIVYYTNDKNLVIENNRIEYASFSSYYQVDVNLTYNSFNYQKKYEIFINANNNDLSNTKEISISEIYDLLDSKEENKYTTDEMYKITGIVVSKVNDNYILYNNDFYIMLTNFDEVIESNTKIELVAYLNKNNDDYSLIYNRESSKYNILDKEINTNERYISENIIDLDLTSLEVPKSKIIKIQITGFFYDGNISDYSNNIKVNLNDLISFSNYELYNEEHVVFNGYMKYSKSYNKWEVIKEGSTLSIKEPECPDC